MAAKIVRVTLDTNILISAFVYGGKPRNVFELVILKELAGIISLPLLVELIETLVKKFHFAPEKVSKIENKIRKSFIVVQPTMILDIVRDKDDNRVLEAAVEGDCDFIITGDRDLLDLKQYKGIEIVTSLEFLSNL